NAQIKAMKQVAGSLKLDLAQYRELAAFTQFGADLDKTTIAQLERGKRLSELLKQEQGVPIVVEKQILALYAGIHGFLDEFPIDRLSLYEKKMLDFIEKNHPHILREIREKKVISSELEQNIQNELKKFAQEFRSIIEGKSSETNEACQEN
ncbi:MAG: F0F1 ATP synthase subunit alpha, partial [Candidatus Aminicenantes bacterium]|nr:F0F1 ATP synthase subunit alpha [Candidatus Aminicenantes bacterium]